MPPISTAAPDSRGKPLASTPTSVEVPPTSATIASRRPGQERRAAQAVGRPAADGQHRVASGVVQCHQGAVVLGEERRRLQPVRRRAPFRRAPATSRATARSAAFSTVAFSRSSRPTEPISWLSETWMSSPSTRARSPRPPARARARDGCEHAGDRDALGRAGQRLEEPARARRRPAGRSRGRRTRCRRRRSASPAETAARRSSRPHHQRRDGGGRRAARCGAPRPARRFRRSSTALVACVVPSITWVTRPGSTPGAESTASIAAAMPPVTSARGRQLGLGDQPGRRGRARRRRCSCRRRRCRAAGRARCSRGELLHGHVVEVVAERPRPGQRESGLACARPGRRGRRSTDTRWP